MLAKKHTRKKQNGSQENKRKLYKKTQTGKYLINSRHWDEND